MDGMREQLGLVNDMTYECVECGEIFKTYSTSGCTSFCSHCGERVSGENEYGEEIEDEELENDEIYRCEKCDEIFQTYSKSGVTDFRPCCGLRTTGCEYIYG